MFRNISKIFQVKMRMFCVIKNFTLTNGLQKYGYNFT